MQEEEKLGERKVSGSGSGSGSVKEEEEEEDKEVVVMMIMDQNRPKKVVSSSTVVDVIPECDVVDDDVDDDTATDLNFESFNDSTTTDAGGASIGLMGASIFTDFKDGSSDSDSSAIFNEDNNNNSPHNKNNHHQFFGSGDDCGGFHFSSDKAAAAAAAAYQPQFVKIEEHNFFSDESCSTFFSDDQAPTLQWDCCPDDWN